MKYTDWQEKMSESSVLTQWADAANILTDFLGVRDIPALNRESLRAGYGIDQVDVMILFGGTIPYGCDVTAKAWRNGIAKRLMAVGGVGHTTRFLRASFQERYPDVETSERTESEMIADYLGREYGIHDILLEMKSTNCGNNVDYALKRLKEYGIEAENILILQEPSMQRRMAAGFSRALGENSGICVISYAPYRPRLTVKFGQLCFEQQYWGLWEIEHYVTLLLGDVSRLRDDEHGYGPKGAGFLPHVDIPDEVEKAFRVLAESGLGAVRAANSAYRSR